jgi:hypothetical protein
MNCEMVRSIEVGETEGGTISTAPPSLHGNTSQVEWAERIKLQVNDEFDSSRSGIPVLTCLTFVDHS